MSVLEVSTAPRTLRSGVFPISIVVAGALVALLVTGDPTFVLVPVIAATVLWAAYNAPMRWTMIALLALAVFADITPHNPVTKDIWVSIASPWQATLLENLNKVSRIEALKVSGMEVALLALALLAALRATVRHSVDQRDRVPAPKVLVIALAISGAAVLWLGFLGAARGGDMRQAFWQCRQLLWMPAFAGLFCYALQGPRDLRVLLVALTATSCAKVAMAAYFVLRVARPFGVEPPTATSHNDTVLYVVVLATWAAIAIDKPSFARIAMAAAVWGWTLFGVALNHRRTAYVSLAATLLLLLIGLSGRARRRALFVSLACLPVLLPYLALARHRSYGIFTPAAHLWSAIEQKDLSSATRDIENFNLVVTMKQHRLIGSGWGHEYIELVKGDDISKAFEQYRYIAHNSVLWLLGIGGEVGFTLLGLPLVVGAFLAARARTFARTNGERVAAFAVIAVIACYLLQAWSDMGVISWTASGLLACALALGGKLAVSSGAWPHPTRASEQAT